MGQLYLTRFSNAPRSSRHTVKRVIIVLFVLAIFHQQRLYLIYRDALIAKYSPTDFGIDHVEAHAQLLRPDDEGLQLHDDLIANRANWKTLGEGCEGKTFKYRGTVIKTFTPGHSPFRNCAPDESGGKWPTEIPASLRFGGFDDVSGQANLTSNGFLPVMAYFKASSAVSAPMEWHLVTPLLEGGSLVSLAKEQNKHLKTYHEIDTQYRPAFDRLLRTLESLHQAGFCHDDVKPGNIFVENASHFILGDLGNLRQVAHPYHSSRLWKENDQLADCRANDVFRALKSYLIFVQHAANDGDKFSNDFFEARQPLSRLFWWASAHKTSITAAKICAQSSIESPQQSTTTGFDNDLCPPKPSSFFWGLFSRKWVLLDAVNRTLKLQLADATARWWAMTGLFGIPVLDVCGS